MDYVTDVKSQLTVNNIGLYLLTFNSYDDVKFLT